MVFSKAIQIKHLVNRWNENRYEFGSGYIVFNCSMFYDGQWSVLLRPEHSTLFFSFELNQLLTLYTAGGIMMTIGSINNLPYIDMQ